MRDNLREHLNTEVTRKQFLQYLGGALLLVFGLNNLVSLLTGKKIEHHVLPQTNDAHEGFGARRFGA